MIYFIRCEGQPFIKIGFTDKTAEERLPHLQTGCPFSLKIVGTITGDLAAEAALHEEYKEFRVNGEWFNMPPTVMANLISHIERQNKYESSKISGTISMREFAAKIGKKPDTVVKLIRKFSIPYITVDGRKRFDPIAVSKWYKEQLVLNAIEMDKIRRHKPEVADVVDSILTELGVA